MSRAVHVVQDDVETADPWLLNPSEDTKQVVKALATAYEQSEYAIATRTKITEILSKSSDIRGLSKGNKGQASFLLQCMTLTKRSFVNMARDPGYYWFRLAIFTLCGLSLGSIFWRVGQHFISIVARGASLVFSAGLLTFMSIVGFPSFVEDMKVFRHERLSGHYGVVAFVVGNSLASIPFLFLIALLSGTLVYFMAHLHPGFGHYAFYILTLFAASLCVEGLMMAICSVVGRNYLLGIIVGASVQVRDHDHHRNYCQHSPLFSE
ncbi:hypothetical protein KC19_5G121900 [Ceratodon purpureus]|uniref:ABC-2 type transporter transmembrane domain-containing protein n=1 Tax=Ceratodon purpureus TaxID=3225 RepID=A0A8T0I335_CERPU|nr:hypothetical protein KC19_5G121900 [Ceratodon purpureus]